MIRRTYFGLRRSASVAQAGALRNSLFRYRRRLAVEQLEGRYLLAGDLLNTAAADVSSLLRSIPAFVSAPYRLVDGLDAADPTDGDGPAVEEAPPFALDQTFLLHSNPGATKVIYLDFNGHTTSGTSWNTSYTSGAAFTTPAYSFEGDSSFSSAELERIQKIWERVAEDYIPFDVDVTTEDPGVDALRSTGGSDTRWGIRVVIGGSSSDWYGSGAGGVAYVGSFTWSSDTPCFVFPAQLGNGNEKYVAEAIAHEAGHTLGLSHDGTSSVSYYEGHGSGATGWAPIMGVGYYRELSQWSKGEYPGANQTQDDLSVITSQNGFTYRADDHGNAMASATALNVAATIVSNAGLIERTTDVDFFSFTTNGSTINLTIDPFYRSPNLDILATLYNSLGVAIATSNPVSALNASFSMALGAGTYYLSIDGTGKPANGTDYGYSDYGSLGRYTISGTIVESTVPGVDVYGKLLAVSPSALLFAGGASDVSLAIENRGTVAAPAFNVRFYLSADATIDPASDLLLALDASSPYYDALDPSAYHVPAGLGTLATHSATVRLAVPLVDPFSAGNQYFVGMFVDADGVIAEADETNNLNRGTGIDRAAVDYSGTIANTAAITIPSSGAAGTYPSTIVVAGLAGKVADVNVSLWGLSHTFPDDLDILLVGPAGQKVLLLSDVGGSPDAVNVNLVLDDQAANSLPNSSQLTSGTYKPTNFGTGDTFPSPAPAGPYAAVLAAFIGASPNGTWSLYIVDDASSNSGSLAGGWGLTFTLANTSPTNPAGVTLAAIEEDAAPAGNLGELVSAIVTASGATDADGNTLGVAVTSVDNSHGQWQYSTNGGSSWQDFAEVSLTAALLLGPAGRVRFVPAADFNSQIAASPTFSFKVWDQTFGVAGGTADATSHNAFSASVATAVQPISAVNDPPEFGLPSDVVMADEDAGEVVVSGFATQVRPGPASASDEAGQQLNFEVIVASASSTLSFAVAPVVDAATGDLSFTLAPNAYGIATIDLVLHDDGSSVWPNQSASVVRQFTIEVAAVNDEEELVVNTVVTVHQGLAAAISPAHLATTDIDDAPAALVYTVVAGPVHGQIQVDGQPATEFTQAQVDAGLVSYQHDGSSEAADSFDFTVDDGHGTASGGTFHIEIRSNAGDYNRDLTVDGADYVMWRKAQGSTVTNFADADGDGDGTVGPEDYAVWRAHFGETVVGGASGEARGASGGELGARSEELGELKAEGGLGSGEGELTSERQAGVALVAESNVGRGGVEALAEPVALIGRAVGRGGRGSVHIGDDASRRDAAADRALVAWLASARELDAEGIEIAVTAGEVISDRGTHPDEGVVESVDECFAALAGLV